MTTNNNFKKFNYTKNKEEKNNKNKFNNNLTNVKSLNSTKYKQNNKFVDKKETEEEQLEREYQRRKFREALLAYDWSKRVPVESTRIEKNDSKKIKNDYKTLSNALKSVSNNKREKISFFRKKLPFLKISKILSRIKEKKAIELLFLKTKKINNLIKFLSSRILLLNQNKLFKKKTNFNFLNIFKKLKLNDIIFLKEKLDSLSNKIIYQNINFFYYKEILSLIPFSFLKNKNVNRTFLNRLYIYLNRKYRNNIISKYHNIIFNIKNINISRLFKKLNILNKNENFTFDYLKIFPLSYIILNNQLFYSNRLSFLKSLRSFYLNKYIFKIFLKSNISKKKILKYGLKKKHTRKHLFSFFRKNHFYFKNSFFFLKNNLLKEDENREMTVSEVSQQSFLKKTLKKSSDEKEILINIFKMKYPSLNNTEINSVLKTFLKNKGELLSNLKKNKKKKQNKISLKLKFLQKKLFFFKHLNIIKSEYLLNKKYNKKFNKNFFLFSKKKSKFFLNLNYIFNRKFLEKKGIKYNVYGYRSIKINKYNIKENKYKLRFKKKKNKIYFLNFIKKNKKYFYSFYKKINLLSNKFKFFFLRKKKKIKKINLSFLNKNKFKVKKHLDNSKYLLSLKNKKNYYLFKKKNSFFYFKKPILFNKPKLKYFNLFYILNFKNLKNVIENKNSKISVFKDSNLKKEVNDDFILEIKKKLKLLKRLKPKNKIKKRVIISNLKFIQFFFQKCHKSTYFSKNFFSSFDVNKDLKINLLRKYDKFKKKRDYISKLKSKKLKLNFSISELINRNYLDKINYYIDVKKKEDVLINLMVSKYRHKNIFIKPVAYYPKLLIGEFPIYKNKDYVYAYWNVNSLYFKFIGFLIREGKRSKAEKIINNSLFFIREFISNNPIFFMYQSIYNSQPIFEYIKYKKRYKTLVVPRITPYYKRTSLSMRAIAKNIRSSELLRKFHKVKSKSKVNSSYLLYNNFVSYFFMKGKIKKDLKENLENAFSKRHLFRKGNSSSKNSKYDKLLKFMSFRKIRGYHF